MANILILPGSKWQFELAQTVKKMDHHLFVVSPEDDPPCKRIADDYFQSDIFAIDDIEKYARDKGVHAIISDECDIAIPVVAELGERLNLCTLSKSAASLYTNKYEMRLFCEAHGINTPRFRKCKNENEAIVFFHEIQAPIILKPLDSNASHGVFIVSSEDDIRERFKESLSFSRIERAVLAEQYINGTEFTVDGVQTSQGHFTLAISIKKHYKHNPNIANELLFKHYNPDFSYDLLKETNDSFVNQSPLKFGLTHAEYKYWAGKYYLIEIGARGGGNMISSLISPYMSGRETYPYLINCSLGLPDNSTFEILEGCREYVSILKFFDSPENTGLVKEIIGEDILKNEPDVIKYELLFSVGDHLQRCESDSARIGYYIACSKNEKSLNRIYNAVSNGFRIIT